MHYHSFLHNESSQGVLKFGFGRDMPPQNLKVDPYKYQYPPPPPPPPYIILLQLCMRVATKNISGYFTKHCLPVRNLREKLLLSARQPVRNIRLFATISTFPYEMLVGHLMLQIILVRGSPVCSRNMERYLWMGAVSHEAVGPM